MSDTSALRNKAEALLRAGQPEPVPILTESELLRIVHELEVHQIELEMVNEELFFQNREIGKREEELIVLNSKLDTNLELLEANTKLKLLTEERLKIAEELIIANKELVFQSKEKEKRADELLVVNKLVSFQRDRLEEIASLVPGVVFQYRQRPDGSSYFPYASEAIKQIYRVTPKMYAKMHPGSMQIFTPMIMMV